MAAREMEILSAFLVAGKHAALDREYERSAADRRPLCPVCDFSENRAQFLREQSTCQFGGGRLERYHCPRCEALFGPSKMLDMTPEELATEYAILYAYYREADTRQETIRTFHSMQPEHGKVYLDWGSGWWADSLTELRAQGFDVWGYEPTPGPGHPFIVSNLGYVKPGLAGIFSNNVIEHFIDPVAAFREMRNLIACGGVMAHSSPCYEMKYMDTRFHTVFYLGDAIHTLASRTGFEVVSRESDGDYMNTIFRAV